MPLKKMTAPESSFNVFSDWLAGQSGARGITPVENTHESTLPHRVFHVDLNDVNKKKGFSRARPVAWRFIQTDENGRVNAHEVRIGDEEDQHHFNEVHYGPATEELYDLVSRVEEFEKLEKVDFEVAYLRMAAIRIQAIWLKTGKKKKDYFIPLSPCFHGLKAGKLYKYKKFRKIVRKAIRKMSDLFEDATDDLIGA